MASRLIWLTLWSSVSVSIQALPTDSQIIDTDLEARSQLIARGAPGAAFDCAQNGVSGTPAAKELLASYAPSNLKSISLGIAMIENGCHFTAAFNPGEGGKTGDMAECGVHRMSWYMFRTYCSLFKGKQPSDWTWACSQLKTDIKSAATCFNEVWGAMSNAQFFQLQRAGPGCKDQSYGQQYGSYVWQANWFFQEDQSEHMTDDYATYWNIPYLDIHC